ncbi:MAG TPA: TIM-barrel domain-containing protein [Bryobacteraceae bacterium]|nr:TIM-barrel domain-containing protein [Bryobacteraceae bacterium]
MPFHCSSAQLCSLFFASLALALSNTGSVKAADASQIVLDRPGETIVLEAYAPNIIRVSLSKDKAEAVAAPGYGFLPGSASAEGWTRGTGDNGDTYSSPRLKVEVAGGTAQGRTGPRRQPLATQVDISKFFNGSAPPAHIKISTAEGETLVDMTGWAMAVPNYKDGNAQVLYDRRPSDKPFFQVGAYFTSPDDEHYYGLGQNQEGYLDRRGHSVEAWHDYNAAAGPSIGVPFIVTNKGYGLVWDNPSKTTVAFGFNGQTRWQSQVGNRVSFFVIAGKTYDEIYSGYRRITGVTPLLSKASYGFIQCKQRYTTQDEVLAVAKGYRERHLPLDMLVVDWFYYSKMGQMDMIPAKWPDPVAMNKQLHEMGIQTMISVWPRFAPGSQFYQFLVKKGWLMHLADGTPTNGLPYDRAGSDIDSTNPAAAQWFWEITRDNFIRKGFDAIWADETEPDLPPNGSYFQIGPGTRYFNVYPLFHTGALYDGFRKDVKHRGVILSRDAYLGAQRNGTIFWSSDIAPNWDTLRRQVPTGLNFTASGFANWSNDIGGWQYLPSEHHPAHAPLIDPSDARDNVGGYDDYPELYTRWYEYGVFQPIFRTHGSRRYNEVWSYGKQAEPILEKFLRLRYQLLPYIYSLAYQTYLTGAPSMRGLFMDFPDDPHVADLGDEYMFGPAFLVAPVTEQGATSRMVYLPAGTDWFNYWTNERVKGGQMLEVNAPIDQIPLFVRAGSIIPTAAPMNSTAEKMTIAKVRVYGGANSDFTLYDDDGVTYSYEQGGGRKTQLHWDDAAGKLTHEGAAAWSGPDSDIVEVIGKQTP